MGWKIWATSQLAGVQTFGDSFTCRAILAPFRARSVSTMPMIISRMKSASSRWLPLNRSGRCTFRK